MPWTCAQGEERKQKILARFTFSNAFHFQSVQVSSARARCRAFIFNCISSSLMYPVVSCIDFFSLRFGYFFLGFLCVCCVVWLCACDLRRQRLLSFGNVWANRSATNFASWSVEMYHRFRETNKRSSEEKKNALKFANRERSGEANETKNKIKIYVRKPTKICSTNLLLDVSCATWPIFCATSYTSQDASKEEKKIIGITIYSRIWNWIMYFFLHICAGFFSLLLLVRSCAISSIRAVHGSCAVFSMWRMRTSIRL